MITNWIRRKLGLLDPKAWRAVADDRGWAGERIGVEEAMQVSAFWACVRLRAQTVGSLALPLYRRRENGREVDFNHPLYTVLHDIPNATQHAAEFWEGVVANMAIWGNAYAEKQMSGRRVIGLEPLPAPCVTPFRNNAGILRYKVNDRGKAEEFPEEKVFHVRGFGVGGDLGLSTLAFARQTLSFARAAERAGGKTFADGLRAKGFFLMPGVMDDEQRAQAQKSLVEPFSGPDGKSLGILEAGVQFTTTNLSPEDAELLMSRRFSVEEVCRWHGVPPIMIGHAGEGQTMWGSGVESLLTQFYTMGLRPDLIRIERAITRSLIAPEERKNIYAEFNIEALLRADSAGRATFYASAVDHGWMTRREVRKRENLPEMPGDDVLTVQSALVPLSDLGKKQPQPAPVRLPPPPANDGEQPPEARRLGIVR